MAFTATGKWLNTWYDYFNRSVFGGKLPNVSLSINPGFDAKGIDGFTKYMRDDKSCSLKVVSLEMARVFPSENYAKSALLHEMIHTEDFAFHPEHFYKNGRWIGDSYHPHGSEFFEKEMDRINGIGMDGIHLIKGKLTKDVMSIDPNVNTNPQRHEGALVVICSFSKKIADSKFGGKTCMLVQVDRTQIKKVMNEIGGFNPAYVFIYDGHIPNMNVASPDRIIDCCAFIGPKTMANVIKRYGLTRIKYWKY